MALNFIDYKKIQITDNNYRALEYIELKNKFFDLGTGWTLTRCFEVDANMTNVTYEIPIFGYSYAPGEAGTTPVGSKLAYMSINSSNQPHVSFGKKETSNSHIGNVSLTQISTSIYGHRCLYRMYVNGSGINLDVEDDEGNLIKTGSDTYSSDDIGLPRVGLCSIYRYNYSRGRYIWATNIDAKLYSFKVRSSKGGQLLQEWLPAQRRTDNKNGLYNTLTGEFILPYTYNVDTDVMTQTSATAGPIIEEQPSWLQKWEVDVIKDSNNTVLWGSPSAFPYRRLEYIDMTGNYIDTLMRPTQNMYFLQFKIDPSDPLVSGQTYAQLWGSIGKEGSTTERIFFDFNSSEIYQRCKTDAQATVKSLSALDANTLYEVRFRAYSDNNTVGQWWYALQNMNTNTELYGRFYNNTSYAMNLAYFPYININRNVFKNAANVTPTANNETQAAGAGKFKVYRYRINITGSYGTDANDMYPAQRKSDGVCGLYDVINEVFYPCQGSNTTTCAGPTVDEFWDLTIPLN